MIKQQGQNSFPATFVYLCQRHQPYGHKVMCGLLQTCTGVSSVCLTKPTEKVRAINYLWCPTVGVQMYWQQAIFVPQLQNFEAVPTQQPEVKEALYHCKTGFAINMAQHLQAKQIVLSFLRSLSRCSLLLFIANRYDALAESTKPFPNGWLHFISVLPEQKELTMADVEGSTS